MRSYRWWIFAAALMMLTIAGGYLLGRATSGGEAALTGVLIDPPMDTEDFTLHTADGSVSLSDLRGDVVVLFFGYTFCPDVCPFTLERLRSARQILGPAGEDVTVVFVSVDPERDTPDRVTEYVRGFDPDFIGLTGSAAEVSKAASSFGIFFAKADADEDDSYYLVDHSAVTLVLDRSGDLRLMWPDATTPEAMATDLAWVLVN